MTADLASLAGMDAPTGLLIGGEWTAGRDGTLRWSRPGHRGRAGRGGQRHDRGRLDAVAAAYAALPGWAATAPRQRAECLRRAFGP